MDCEEVKKIIPRYFQHTASEEEIKKVEEHLCICHDCRTTLGELMDKLSEPESSEPQEIPKEGIDSASQEQTPSLGGLEDNQEISQPSAQEPLPVEQEEEPKPSSTESSEMEYFAAKDEINSEEEITPEPEEKPLDQEEPSKPDSEPVSSYEEKPELEEKEPEIEKEQFSTFKIDEPSVPEDEEEKKDESHKEDIPVIEEEPASALDMKKTSWHLENDEKSKERHGEESTFPLDKQPLEKKQVNPLSYVSLAVGLIIFLFFIYLRIKG